MKNDFEALTICLRLAVLFNRGHHDTDLSQLEFSKIPKGYVLGLPSVLLKETPLLHADLEQEKKYLKDAGIQLQLKIN